MGEMSVTTQPSTADAQPATTVLVCGARTMFDRYDGGDLTDRQRGRILARALFAAGVQQSEVREVVHGANRGSPDGWGEAWATETDTPHRPFEPDWNDISHPDAIVREGRYGKYDKRAGIRRNEQMADYLEAQSGPSLVVAFWDGDSRGTSHMIDEARSRDLPVEVFRLDRPGQAAALVGEL